MKRFFILALVLTVISGTAFSKNINDVNQKVLTAFNKKFTRAEDVKWEVRKDLYRAEFKLNGQVIFAYFDASGEQVAASRHITVSQLPISLATELQGGYDHYWLTELFEVSARGETIYYATVESPSHIVTYKADRGSSWMVYKKVKKED